jgi:hypothetical protein
VALAPQLHGFLTAWLTPHAYSVSPTSALVFPLPRRRPHRGTHPSSSMSAAFSRRRSRGTTSRCRCGPPAEGGGLHGFFLPSRNCASGFHSRGTCVGRPMPVDFLTPHSGSMALAPQLHSFLAAQLTPHACGMPPTSTLGFPLPRRRPPHSTHPSSSMSAAFSRQRSRGTASRCRCGPPAEGRGLHGFFLPSRHCTTPYSPLLPKSQ